MDGASAPYPAKFPAVASTASHRAPHRFDPRVADAQATAVQPLDPSRFDSAAYADYEARLLDRCRAFWSSRSGVAVYRRFRPAGVFAGVCRDPRRSLALQLGALRASMAYEADIPNFLEPWYGIGVAASALGAGYGWPGDDAPAIARPFATVEAALAAEPVPVERTPIGRRVLDMIGMFLDATGGRVPISLTDTQSPLNAASFLVDSGAFYLAVHDAPEALGALLDRLADATIAFSRAQMTLIGDALARPGHGFASCRAFGGLGLSCDVAVTMAPGGYRDLDGPRLTRAGRTFGGVAFHSCGDWSGWIPVVQAVPGLVMIDGAFSAETDPKPNPPEPFARAFRGGDAALHARVVGSAERVAETVRALWRPPMRLIVTTYCATPEEQARTYAAVHAICEGAK
jgi:hypothetical protein